MVYAGFWRRFVAAFIDGILLSVLEWLVVAVIAVPLILGAAAGGASEEAVGMALFVAYFLGSLVGLAIGAAYSILLIGWRGQTVGMMALGIKVVRTDGSPVDYVVALVRWLGSLLSSLGLCLGYLWIAFHPRKQAWHDMIADTYVIRLGAATEAARPPAV